MEKKIKNIEDPVCRDCEFIKYEFDEALEFVGHGKFHWLLLVITGFCLMAFITESLNIGFVVPMAECDLQLTMSNKGVLNGSAFLGVLLSSYFWGFLADTWGRRKVLLLSTSMTFFVSILSSVSVNVWMLIATKFLVGFFISACASNTFAYLGEFHPEKSRSQSLSFAGTFMGFSFIFCPGVAWIIAHLPVITFQLYNLTVHVEYWRIFLFISACLSGISALGLYFLPESPKFLLAQGNMESALLVLRKVYEMNTGNSVENYPVHNVWLNENTSEESTDKHRNYFALICHQTILLFKKPLLKLSVLLGFVNFALVASSSGFYLWVPNILNNLMKSERMDISVCDAAQQSAIKREQSDTCSGTVDSTVFVITFFMGVYFAIGYVINGLIVKKAGNQKLLAIIFFLSTVCGVLIPFTTNFYLIVFLLYQFLVTGVGGSLMSAIIVEMFPTNIRAMALCLILFIGRFGAIAGSNAVAHFMIGDCHLMFILFGIISFVNGISVLLLSK